MIIFVVIEIVLALISLIQVSRSKEEYAKAQHHKERVMKNFELCFDVAISQVVDWLLHNE